MKNIPIYLACLFLFTFTQSTAFSNTFESFQYENKGSASATEILTNSKQPLGVLIEGDAAKAIYLKIAVKPKCLSEDANSEKCVILGKNIHCSKQTNSRASFYKCSLLVDKNGKLLPH